LQGSLLTVFVHFCSGKPRPDKLWRAGNEPKTSIHAKPARTTFSRAGSPWRSVQLYGVQDIKFGIPFALRFLHLNVSQTFIPPFGEKRSVRPFLRHARTSPSFDGSKNAVFELFEQLREPS